MMAEKSDTSRMLDCTDSASTNSKKTFREESLATDAFRTEKKEMDVESYTLAIANYLYVKHEDFQQGALKRFKSLMKLLWKSIDKLKSNPREYASAFVKFEKHHRGLSRNDIKFVFDRLIDILVQQPYPRNIFDLKNAIGNLTFNKVQFTPAFFSSPGIKEIYSLHHQLAANSEFYFQLNLFHGRMLTQDEKYKIVEYCGLISKLNS